MLEVTNIIEEMNSKKTIKSIVIMSIIAIITLLFVTISFASNTAKISVETARLREEASENAKVLELVSLGEEVEILNQSGNWYQVEYKGITGYLRSDLVQLKSNELQETNIISENTTQPNNVVDNTQTSENTNQTANQDSNTASQQESNQEEEKDANQSDENVTEESKKDLMGYYQFIGNTEIKIIPLINSLTVQNAKTGEQVQIADKINGWVLVADEEKQGWVRFEQLSKVEEQENTSNQMTTENKQEENSEEENEEQNKQNTQEPEVTQPKTMYINSKTVNVRSSADKSSQIVTQLAINEQVTVLSEENGWSKVTINGKEGYILSTLLSAQKQVTTRSASEARTTDSQEEKEKEKENAVDETPVSTSSTKGEEVLAYAMKYIGSKYVYGGSSPRGFDCSGFTSYVYKNFEVTLSRTAAGQYSNGRSVSKSELQAGDLVMFCSPINHVGIYVGEGKIVHAANTARGVTTDTINSGYYATNYYGARRIF